MKGYHDSPTTNDITPWPVLLPRMNNVRSAETRIEWPQRGEGVMPKSALDTQLTTAAVCAWRLNSFVVLFLVLLHV